MLYKGIVVLLRGEGAFPFHPFKWEFTGVLNIAFHQFFVCPAPCYFQALFIASYRHTESSDVNFLVVDIFRVKMLKEVPYTTEEAEKAAGMGSYTLTSTKPLLPVNEDEEMTNTETVESAGT